METAHPFLSSRKSCASSRQFTAQTARRPQRQILAKIINYSRNGFMVYRLLHARFRLISAWRKGIWFDVLWKLLSVACTKRKYKRKFIVFWVDLPYHQLQSHTKIYVQANFVIPSFFISITVFRFGINISAAECVICRVCIAHFTKMERKNSISITQLGLFEMTIMMQSTWCSCRPSKAVSDTKKKCRKIDYYIEHKVDDVCQS